jgi:hypothetical protein
MSRDASADAMDSGLRDWLREDVRAKDALLKVFKFCDDELSQMLTKGTGQYYPFYFRRMSQVKKLCEEGLQNGPT